MWRDVTSFSIYFYNIKVPFARKTAGARDCVCMCVYNFFYINLLT